MRLSLAATKGYASAEVQHAYARPKQLCDQLDESPESWFVLHGLWTFYVLRGRLETARKLALQLHRQAQANHGPAERMEALRALGVVEVYLGTADQARGHLEQALSLFEPERDGTNAVLYGQNTSVILLPHSAWACWLLGYPEQAERAIRSALARAELCAPLARPLRAHRRRK